MPATDEALDRLTAISRLKVRQNVALAQYTRFAIGGPADVYAETSDPQAFVKALEAARSSGTPHVVIGGGTNLVVSDEGFRGLVLRYTANRISAAGHHLRVDAGAVLQDLVDFANEHGLKGLETLAGIPGSTGAAIYGNAGAYGHSISERVREVRFYDSSRVRVFSKAECEFRYRESAFKRRKDWIIFSVELEMLRADPEELKRVSADILKVRNEKFPVTMKCAGSIFKNLLLAELPPDIAAKVPASVVREGKIPSAYFLEQVGAKGMQRGDIHVAGYHANLIYNAGEGTASDLAALIGELKARVRERFGITLEEEVQYVGFTPLGNRD
jgi:UDP-N-acetylmuramate dehydrogenase